MDHELALPLLDQPIRLRHAQKGAQQVFDPIRRRWVAFTPEEHVRQRLLGFLIGTTQYPAARIAVEKSLGTPLQQRFDVVIYGADHQPWMLVECKAPEVPITAATLLQLLRYHAALPCRYWLLTNGLSTYCAAPCGPDGIAWLDRLPAYDLF